MCDEEWASSKACWWANVDFGEAGMAEDLEEGPHEDGPNWMTQEAFDSEISSVNGPENTQSYDDTGGEAGGNLEEISGLSHEVDSRLAPSMIPSSNRRDKILIEL